MYSLSIIRSWKFSIGAKSRVIYTQAELPPSNEPYSFHIPRSKLNLHTDVQSIKGPNRTPAILDELGPRVGEHEVLDGSFCVVKDVLVEAGEVESTAVGRWREIRTVLEAVGL